MLRRATIIAALTLFPWQAAQSQSHPTPTTAQIEKPNFVTPGTISVPSPPASQNGISDRAIDAALKGGISIAFWWIVFLIMRAIYRMIMRSRRPKSGGSDAKPL